MHDSDVRPVISQLLICLISFTLNSYTYVQSNYVKIYRETEKTVFEAMAKVLSQTTFQISIKTLGNGDCHGPK